VRRDVVLFYRNIVVYMHGNSAEMGNITVEGMLHLLVRLPLVSPHGIISARTAFKTNAETTDAGKQFNDFYFAFYHYNHLLRLYHKLEMGSRVFCKKA
jgi:hypothetical protein